jgi:hypothetical protein
MEDFPLGVDATLEEILQLVPQDPFFELWCLVFLLLPLRLVAWRAYRRRVRP